MITKWTVSNFMSIRAESELEFSPLMIFAGANSSGESTLSFRKGRSEFNDDGTKGGLFGMFLA